MRNAKKRARRTMYNVWYREKQEIICFQVIIYLRIDHFPLMYDLRGKCNIKQSCVRSTLKSRCISVCGMWLNKDIFKKVKILHNIRINISNTYMMGI